MLDHIFDVGPSGFMDTPADRTRYRRRDNLGQAPMSVEGYIGKWGDGKTYMLAKEGIQAITDPKCLGVFATFHIDELEPKIASSETIKNWTTGQAELIGQWYVETRETFRAPGKVFHLPTRILTDVLPLIRVPKPLIRQGYYVLILIDEINVILPSRMWSQLPVDMLYSWGQGRKRGHQVRWSAQSERRVDAVAREVTQFIHECRAKLGSEGSPWFFRVRKYEAEDISLGETNRKRVRISSKWYRRKDSIQTRYDTLEEVEPSAHLQQRIRKAG